MSLSYNNALIIGNLTADPELKKLDSGTSIATFSIATNRTYKDSNGQQQEDAQFHNIVVFGRQAETSAQYLQKGSQALVEGRIQTRSWENDNGEKRYRTEIVANRVQFGARAKNESFESVSKDMSKKKHTGDGIDYPEDNSISPEDIPF